jgi:hypothetical protein
MPRLDELRHGLAAGGEHAHGGGIVLAHQAAVALRVRAQDGGQPALEYALVHDGKLLNFPGR